MTISDQDGHRELRAQNDSPAQQEHRRENLAGAESGADPTHREKAWDSGEGNTIRNVGDKRLDGPNRPAT